MGYTIGSYRELLEALSEVPDHYLDQPIEVWIDDEVLICQHHSTPSVEVLSLQTGGGALFLYFTNANLEKTIKEILNR